MCPPKPKAPIVQQVAPTAAPVVPQVAPAPAPVAAVVDAPKPDATSLEIKANRGAGKLSKNRGLSLGAANGSSGLGIAK